MSFGTDLKYAEKYPTLAMGTVLTWPNPILDDISEEVPADFDTQELAWIVDQMTDLLHKHNAVGLAAPQVGISLRLFVMRSRHENGDAWLDHVFINPSWLLIEGVKDQEDSKKVTVKEGCLSFPGLTVEAERYDKVLVSFQDLETRAVGIVDVTQDFEGLDAQCIQHETEHLDGITFYTRMGPVKRDIWRRKQRKLGRRKSRQG